MLQVLGMTHKENHCTDALAILNSLSLEEEKGALISTNPQTTISLPLKKGGENTHKTIITCSSEVHTIQLYYPPPCLITIIHHLQ